MKQLLALALFSSSLLAQVGFPSSTPCASALQAANSGTVQVPMVTAPNLISGTTFYVPGCVTFSNISFVAANGAFLSGAAIIDLSTGMPLCHNSVGVPMTANHTPVIFPCAEGQVTLSQGWYGKIWTSTSTLTMVMSTEPGADVETWASTNVTGCVASNGVIDFTTPCNILLQMSAAVGGNPNILLF